ncbi:6194_t:CDS:2, partial [Acaulospora morrowiae]
LSDVVWHDKYVPISIITTIRAINVNLNYKDSLKGTKVSWLQGLLAIFIIGFGGSTTSAILCGKVPGWLASNTTITTYLIIHFMMFYFSPFHRFLVSLPKSLIDPIFLIVDGIQRTNSICLSGVDLVRFGMYDESLMNTSWAAILLCGTLSGCGGGIWASALQVSSPKWSFNIPSAIIEPTFNMKTSFAIALFYALITSPQIAGLSLSPIVDIDQGRTLAIIGMIGLNFVKFNETLKRTRDTKTQKKIKKN